MAGNNIDRIFDDAKRDGLPSTRKEAKTLGAKRYYTGLPCPKGHYAPRHTSSAVCCVCDTEKKRLRYAAEPEKYRARSADWRRENHAKQKEMNASWYAKNRDRVLSDLRSRYLDKRHSILTRRKKLYAANSAHILAKNKRWRWDNPEAWKAAARKTRIKHQDKVYARNRNRRARERGAKGIHSPGDIECIRMSQGDKCVYCSVLLLGKGHVDHRIPLSRGGSNWPENLQLLCASCNCRKGALTHDEYIKRRRGTL